MTQTIDEANCPLCGKLNHCARAAKQNAASCWCHTTHVPSELRANPKVAHTQTCLCKCCIEAFEAAQKTQ